MSGRAVRLTHPSQSRHPIGGFPAVVVGADVVVWRCHQRNRGPWWFASDGTGRFDLADPHGTCYLADLEVIACLEAISHGATSGLVVTPEFLDARVLRPLALPAGVPVADATDGGGRRFGVTLEVHDTPDYTIPQAWAAAWHACGFAAVHYLATNHQPTVGDEPWTGPGAQGPGSWALFGEAGEPKRWRKGRAHRITGALGAELRRYGVRVESPPASAASVTVVAPPT